MVATSQPTIVTDGTWHRIAFVWNGSTRALYVDGVLVAKDTDEGRKVRPSDFRMGVGKAMQAGTFWSGLIDDVRIYNRAVRP